MAEEPVQGGGQPPTLIVASDGSEFSEGAVREGLDWARRCQARVVGVCVSQVGLGRLMYADPEIVREQDRNSRNACETLEQRAREAGVPCEIVIHEAEDPSQPIVDEAAARQADAIVVGRRGRRALMRLLMGSVTALTVGHAPCSVFVVPRDGRLAGQRLLVASDGSADSERAAHEAVRLAGCTGGALLACSIAHGAIDTAAARANAERVQELAGEAGIAAEILVDEGTPYERITALAGERGADLIVVGSHGRTGLKKLLMGSVTERVIGLAPCSVLVVK